MANCSDTCFCRNLVCAITFLTIGIVFIIAGGVIAAVGFGTRPIDMFDTHNLAMRVAGLILAAAGILPVIMGAMFAFFYCANKRGKLPGQKKSIKPNVEMSVITKPNAGQVEYPYPSDGGPLIYKPGLTANGSIDEDEHYDNDNHYALPITHNSRSFNGGAVDTAHIYSEVKESQRNGSKTNTKTTTTTTTVTTRVHKTDIDNVASGSFDENVPQGQKAKRKKKHQPGPDGSNAGGSLSSEVPSSNEGDVLVPRKSKHSKQQKKEERHDRYEDEAFDETDEPLPGGRHRSSGSSSTDTRKPSVKTTTSPSFEDDDSNMPPAAVYGNVKKKRNNRE